MANEYLAQLRVLFRRLTNLVAIPQQARGTIQNCIGLNVFERAVTSLNTVINDAIVFNDQVIRHLYEQAANLTEWSRNCSTLIMRRNQENLSIHDINNIYESLQHLTDIIQFCADLRIWCNRARFRARR